MSVTQNVMATGDWALRLHQGTPWAVLNELDLDTDAYGHIIITRSWLDPRAISPGGLFALSDYSGVYRGARNLRELSGCGPSMWLGDEDDKGHLLTGLGPYDTDFATWMALVTSGQTNVTAGTITNPSAGSLSWTFPDYGPGKEIADYVCDYFGAEWRVNPNRTFDAGTPTVLYGATPTAIATSGEVTASGDLRGIRSRITVDEDVEDFTTHTHVKTAVGSYYAATLSPIPYITNSNAGAGSLLRMSRHIDASTANTTNASGAAVASSQLGRFDQVRRQLTISTDEYMLPAAVTFGANLYVYDPDNRVYSTATQVYYAGQVVFPETHRIQSWTWPVREGMGVYFASGDSTHNAAGAQPGTLTDLTPYVEWESGDATIQVGAPIRTLSRAMKRTNLIRA